MKTSQLLLAVLVSAVLLFAWSYLYWILVNPVALAYQAGAADLLSQVLSQPPNAGAQLLKDASQPQWIGHLTIAPVVEANNVSQLVKSALSSFTIALVAALLIWVTYLHRGTFMQRFVLIIGFGVIQTIKTIHVAVMWPDAPGSIIFRYLIFDWGFWLILAFIMALQMGTRKRNLFL